MNIYNFIYISFNLFWEKRDTDGRIIGSCHVIFAFIIHLFLINEILYLIIGVSFIPFANNGIHFEHIKLIFLLFATPIGIAIWLFYNKKRTEKLKIEYIQKFSKNRATFLMLLYMLVPTILVILLGMLRQNY